MVFAQNTFNSCPLVYVERVLLAKIHVTRGATVTN
jgi:hypothetical protein